MADELDGLLARVDDPALRADLRTQIDRIRAKRTFGLVFESHLPERVRLPEHPVRAGTLVVLRDERVSPIFQVLRSGGDKVTVRAVRHPDGSRLSPEEAAKAPDEERLIVDLVVIADFGQAIYPGLRMLGTIARGGDKPAHVVIKGENYHVLQALQFSHAGKVDCIYIDPPYNTGARDWKYDNNYVDDTDAYRHSKWLAFMERRLLLAKELLNPERSVLIVTIDEKEVHRLGLLLEQLFPEAKRQMTTIVINPNGVARGAELARVEEYAFFLFFGTAAPCRLSDTLLDQGFAKKRAGVRWEWLMRGGSNSRRIDRPNLFYPIYVDAGLQRIHSVGEALPLDVDRDSVPDKPGLTTLWPVRADGTEANWRTSPGYLRELLASGHAKLGAFDHKTGRWSVLYLGKAQIRRIESGEIVVVGRDKDGSLMLEVGSTSLLMTPKTVWNRPQHSAGEHGSRLLRSVIPGRTFPFPKSLFAVEDALRVAVGDNPEAVVLDFFAGSGTTTHAVARLNRQDGGRRQSIVVTNNEVSAAEAESLRKRGLRPGDPEWEDLGIFEHITRPRVAAVITGLTPDGERVKGDYKFNDEFPMAEGLAENAAFAELVYLDPDDVELDLAFASVAPLLWLRAGSQGPVIDECMDDGGGRKPYAWTSQYGVLFNPDRWRSFVEKLPDTATTAFVVTDSQATFAGIAAELPDHLDIVRLYENYLTTFRINEGLG